jgi:N utilization substance protein A
MVRTGLLVSLFAGLVPELRSGAVRIMGVARVPGKRSKVSVAATTPGIDPVAALVGRDAAWVRTVSRLLHGERIEIVAWHPDLQIRVSNALAPASARSVKVGDAGVRVQVDEAQMPAAVGDDGMNRQLVSELIGLDVSLEAIPAA